MEQQQWLCGWQDRCEASGQQVVRAPGIRSMMARSLRDFTGTIRAEATCTEWIPEALSHPASNCLNSVETMLRGEARRH